MNKIIKSYTNILYILLKIRKKIRQKRNQGQIKNHTQNKLNNNYSASIPKLSSQVAGHQYHKDHVQFAPQAQQSHTDNIVGELV